MASYKALLEEAYAGSFRVEVPNEQDCSGFLIAAAEKAAGVHLPTSQADGLLDCMEANWDKIGTGQKGLKGANAAASAGSFVVVGASAADLHDTNGHVAVPLARSRDGWALIYGGAGNPAARTKGEKTLNYVFRREYHPNLRYFSPKFTNVPAFDSD